MLRRLLLMSGGCFAIAFVGNSALAQITPDNTLGVQRSNVTPNVNIKGSLADQIDGGASRGVNLFHSFSQFNINNGQQVYFSNPAGIENILTRVTGGNPSNIQGLLGVNGNANLFLINPNGIIFGRTAQLDIGGSFVASTANSIVFPNGYQFSATNPQASQLLTINVPIGLQYGSQPGAIRVQQSSLKVPTGKTLMLVGGEVNLEGANLIAPGGRVELTGVGGAGNIGLNVDENNLRLSPSGVARADVSLTNGAVVNVRSFGGGSIAINAQNLTLAGNSKLQAGIDQELGSVNSKAGDIDINVTGAITLKDNSFISNALRPGAIGKGGNINITTGSLFATDGAEIYASTRGTGDAGNITIQASKFVSFDGQMGAGRSSGAISEVESTGVGKGGSITITTPSLSLSNGGVITTGTLGKGDAGSVFIKADTISIDGQGSDPDPNRNFKFFSSGVYNRVQPGGEGNPGSIEIVTGLLSATNGGVITTSTEGKGDGGRVTINADYVTLSGVGADGTSSGILTSTEPGAVGKGGEITVNTPVLRVKNGAVVNARTANASDGGSVTIDASSISVIGTSADGQTPSSLFLNSSDAGNAGKLKIRTGRLLIWNGGNVSAITSGTGRAGTLHVKASDSVSVIGTSTDGKNVSGLFFDSSGSGNAGYLRISTGKLIVRDGGNVSASTSEQGQAGTLAVKADTVEVTGVSADGKNPSQLFFDSSGAGNAGKLSVNTRILTVLDGGQVSAATSSSGKGGILAVDASESVVVSGKNGDFVSRLYFDSKGTGDARGISIKTGNFIAENGGEVTVSGTASGIAGDLELIANSVVLKNQAKLTASTNNSQGGSVKVTASDTINISGESSVLAKATGNGTAGSVKIDTNQLSVSDRSTVAVSSDGEGNAGDLNITAQGVFLNNQAKLSAETISAVGGNINLQGLSLLSLSDNSAISASTKDGQGGTVEINTKDSINLTGNSGVFASATGSGSAGNLRLNTNQLTLQDGSQATVSNTGSGGTGNLEVTANSIFLTNQANLLAKTTSGEGGNIRLQVADTVLLRNNSNILTEALGTGNGGNITINAGNFVLAILPENSDIAATAIQGRGGNIFVTAQGVFGFSLPERLVRTPESDISAASQLGINGTREVNTRDVQPVPLPANPDLPEIAQDCDVNRNSATGQPAKSQFYNTGRGGLPPNPSEALNSNTAVVPWVTEQENPSVADSSTTPNKIVEAQGWVRLPDGKVLLSAPTPPVIPLAGCKIRISQP